MKLEDGAKNIEPEALKPVGFVELHIQQFFFKTQESHMQPNCMTSTVSQMQCSVARNMLILGSSSWKTLVWMVNLGGYQYLQANSQRKGILQLYMTTCLYRLKAINALLNWASPSSDHCNDFQTAFRQLVEEYFLHLQGITPFLCCKLLRFSASPWLAPRHDAEEQNAPRSLWRLSTWD